MAVMKTAKLMRSPSNQNSQSLRYVWRASRRGLIAIVTFGAFINLLKFAMPLYTLQILDRVPASRSVETLIMLTVIAIPAVVSGVALHGVRRRMLTRWGAWIERQYGPRLLRVGMTRRNGSRSVAVSPGLKDLARLRTFVSGSAAAWLDVIWAPVFIVAVYLVHPTLGWMLVIAVTLLIALGLLRDRATRETRRASSHASSDADELIRSIARNSETVQAYGMEMDLTERWGQNAAICLDERDRTESRTALFAAIEQGLYRSVYVGGLGMGMWLVIQDALTLGGVIAGNIMIRFAFRLVARPARKWRSLVNARRAYQRLAKNLGAEPTADVSIRQADLDHTLSFDSVTHRYPGQPDAVFRNLDLEVMPGEILCVVGPSATGKTTLSRLVTGILAPRTGRVRLGDIDISRLPSEMRARLVGYLPQDIRLFKGTIRDNIARMSDGSFEDVVAAAKIANIHETIVNLPKGYDTEIDENASILSGGERKRLALARAYFGTPRILVLDEPEANLDRRSRWVVIQVLQFFRAQGSLVVVTTQTSSLGKIADKVLILGGNRAQIVNGNEIESPAKNRESGPHDSINWMEQAVWEERQ